MIVLWRVPDISYQIMLAATNDHGCPGLSWVMDPDETVLGKCTWRFTHDGCVGDIPVWSPGWASPSECIRRVDEEFHKVLNAWP